MDVELGPSSVNSVPTLLPLLWAPGMGLGGGAGIETDHRQPLWKIPDQETRWLYLTGSAPIKSPFTHVSHQSWSCLARAKEPRGFLVTQTEAHLSAAACNVWEQQTPGRRNHYSRNSLRRALLDSPGLLLKLPGPTSGQRLLGTCPSRAWPVCSLVHQWWHMRNFFLLCCFFHIKYMIGMWSKE